MENMWDKKASSYPRFDGNLNAFQMKFFAKLNEFGVNFSNKSVIDIGCGTGIYSLYLAKICSQITCLDGSLQMLNLLMQDAQKFGLTNFKALQTRFDDFKTHEHYDIAFCTMSPAVKNEADFEKFISLGDERVHLFWNKPRYSSVLEHIYEILDIKIHEKKTDVFENFLKKQNVKFHSCVLDDERLVVRGYEQAVENVLWHLQISNVKFDEKAVKNALFLLKKDEKIEEKIVSSMKLLVF
ncbi:MAG: class I SAM-dependent methyltransferase [Campylobacter sp.]